MTQKPVLKLALAAALMVVLTNVVSAATSYFASEPELVYKGSWYWNSASSSRIQVRILNDDNEGEFDRIRVVVKARAVDGTTVQGQTIVLVKEGSTRDFNINLSKPITSLVLIQATELPTND